MPLSIGALQQIVEQNDQKNEEAHKRLRTDLRDQETATYELEKRLRELSDEVMRLKSAPPPDVTTLRFPLPIVLGIALGFMSIGGGILKLQSDIAAAKDSNTNQIQNLKETITRLDQQQRLQYAEFQTFRQEMARSQR